MSFVVAIDGPAASGKGTISQLIAQELGFAHLDTGAVYRYVAYRVLEAGLDETREAEVIALARDIAVDFSLNDFDVSLLRNNRVGQMTSKISAIAELRTILKDIQVQFALYPPKGELGAVLDGRDIGTVICPDADVKLYVVASTEVRAQRRLKELQLKDKSATYEAVLRDMRERDERDSNRSVAPLKPADDAIIIDTSHLTIENALQKALEEVGKVKDVKAK